MRPRCSACPGSAITKETDGYWSFNMLHTVSDGATSLTLTYDSEHARITQVLTTASTSTTTTYLNDPISGTMSEKVVSGTTTTWNDYLMVDGKLTAERSLVVGGLTTMSWFVLDHLGSVAVITDAGGNVLATNGRQSFDAWGKQRHEDGSDDLTCSQPLTSPTTRGFTGQEEIGALCLIDMNARLYDPNIGRFLSADTVVPDAYDLQSYNRYTYVDNRPLSFTDPTGHLPGEPEDCGDGCVVIVTRPGVAGGIVVNPGDSKYPPHGTMSDLDNCKGGPTSFQQFWVSALTVGLGAKNVSVTVNPNGSLALNFTCGGGDSGCVSGGRAINAVYGGTENYAGGEETDAADNANGDTSNDAYRYTGPSDEADKQAAKAWTDDNLSDGTRLHLHDVNSETGFTVSPDGTKEVPFKNICVKCSDGVHEGTQFDFSQVSPGSYPGHAHTLRQGKILGPGDNSGVDKFGKAYVLTPQGAFAVQPWNNEAGYLVRQLIGEPLSNEQINQMMKFVNQWNKPGGAGCHIVSC